VVSAQQSVSVSPASVSAYAGDSVTFTASGGQNGYQWGGAAGGTGSSNTVYFGSTGTYTVSVYSPAGNGYLQSDTAYASVTVDPDIQNVSLTPTSTTVNVGQSVTFNASGSNTGYDWSGAAGGTGSSQTVTFNSAGTFTVTVTAPAGGDYAASSPVSCTVTVVPIVTVSPSSSSIHIGDSVTFTASGGPNGYVWGGSTSGTGSSQTVTFNASGSYTVTVYSPAGSGYAQSNTATAAIEVNAVIPTVTITPSSTTVAVGQTVTFSAGGGPNGYVWGGSASGSGSTKSVTFNTVGTAYVWVYSPAGGIYGQSDAATATITVTSLQNDSSNQTQLKVLVPTP
jgi:plastocyanin